MKGWQIFVHSVRQVFGNLDGALRVSGVLFLIQIGAGVLFGGTAFMAQGQMMQGGMGAGFFLGALVELLVSIVTSLWIAVGWHRYILIGETAGFVPTYHGDRIWAYLLRSLGYGIILVLLAVVWGGVVGYVIGSVFAGSMALTIILMGVLVYLPLLVVAFRMTSDLPATALGVERPFMSGWAALAGQTADLISLAAIIVVFAVLSQLIGIFVFGQIAVLSLIWSLLFGWVQMMIGISILTTLYGHYIEKRALV